jgi:hypothetical protein
MKLLFDNLPSEYSGIALERLKGPPLEDLEEFYENFENIDKHSEYLFKDKTF